jgi:hypothetical protein
MRRTFSALYEEFEQWLEQNNRKRLVKALFRGLEQDRLVAETCTF